MKQGGSNTIEVNNGKEVQRLKRKKETVKWKTGNNNRKFGQSRGAIKLKLKEKQKKKYGKRSEIHKKETKILIMQEKGNYVYDINNGKQNGKGKNYVQKTERKLNWTS